jgi:hypothetical protein
MAADPAVLAGIVPIFTAAVHTRAAAMHGILNACANRA